MAPIDYSFTRYLSAKKSVDDRALNSHVWQTLVAALPDGPLRVLEIGSGIGTMAERLVERGVLTAGTYTAVDAEPANTAAARARLQALPAAVQLELVTDDAFRFATLEQGRRAWDALIAHAFLDLVDVTAGAAPTAGAAAARRPVLLHHQLRRRDHSGAGHRSCI
jgi:SAM-dependent methyltransferase